MESVYAYVRLHRQALARLAVGSGWGWALLALLLLWWDTEAVLLLLGLPLLLNLGSAIRLSRQKPPRHGPRVMTLWVLVEELIVVAVLLSLWLGVLDIFLMAAGVSVAHLACAGRLLLAEGRGTGRSPALARSHSSLPSDWERY